MMNTAQAPVDSRPTSATAVRRRIGWILAGTLLVASAAFPALAADAGSSSTQNSAPNTVLAGGSNWSG